MHFQGYLSPPTVTTWTYTIVPAIVRHSCSKCTHKNKYKPRGLGPDQTGHEKSSIDMKLHFNTDTSRGGLQNCSPCCCCCCCCCSLPGSGACLPLTAERNWARKELLKGKRNGQPRINSGRYLDE